MAHDFDPLTPETFDSANEEYARLREQCPVAHSDAWGGFWALMKHEDVAEAASDWKTFITSQQNVIPKVASAAAPRSTGAHAVSPRTGAVVHRASYRSP
jgi:cytochrome P450